MINLNCNVIKSISLFVVDKVIVVVVEEILSFVIAYIIWIQSCDFGLVVLWEQKSLILFLRAIIRFCNSVEKQPRF